MSKKSMRVFIENLRGNDKLAEEFAKAAATVARRHGYDVDEQDIKELMNRQPTGRPLPPGEGKMTTLAVGEEDKGLSPSVTCAIGEEDGGKMTSAAVGEEEGAKKPPLRSTRAEDDGKRRATTQAVGEEDKRKPRPPKP